MTTEMPRVTSVEPLEGRHAAMSDPELNALLARIEDLEDVVSVYEARADCRSIPWEAVKAATGFPPSQ